MNYSAMRKMADMAKARLRVIEANVDKLLAVEKVEAQHFACNAVNIGEMVFLNQASDPLKARLMLNGFKVREVNLSEFLKAGGSAKCLTLKLIEPEFE